MISNGENKVFREVSVLPLSPSPPLGRLFVGHQQWRVAATRSDQWTWMEATEAEPAAAALWKK